MNYVLLTLTENLRKVLRKMQRNLKFDERDASFTDLLNHADTLAENIEQEIRKCNGQ